MTLSSAIHSCAPTADLHPFLDRIKQNFFRFRAESPGFGMSKFLLSSTTSQSDSELAPIQNPLHTKLILECVSASQKSHDKGDSKDCVNSFEPTFPLSFEPSPGRWDAQNPPTLSVVKHSDKKLPEIPIPMKLTNNGLVYKLEPLNPQDPAVTYTRKWKPPQNAPYVDNAPPEFTVLWLSYIPMAPPNLPLNSTTWGHVNSPVEDDVHVSSLTPLLQGSTRT